MSLLAARRVALWAVRECWEDLHAATRDHEKRREELDAALDAARGVGVPECDLRRFSVYRS